MINRFQWAYYSWDSTSYQLWVRKLVNKLREESGVVATYDQFETQKGTTHLPKMMIEKVRDSDYIIIVLTKKYAERADNFEGGVGFENMSFLSLLQENKDKLIFIKRDSVNFNEVVPFQFKGYYFIDFSNEDEFEKKYEELIYRIYNVPLFEEAPLGNIPTLKPKKIHQDDQTSRRMVNPFSGSINHFYRTVTDLDKDNYLKQCFKEIKSLFTQLFDRVRLVNPSVEYQVDEISNYKVLYNLYQNGSEVTSVKIWIGSQFGKGINFSIGQRIDPYQDNSMNEIVTCEVDHNNNLFLKTTMNMSGSNASTPKEVVEEIWKRSIQYNFRS